MAEDKIKIHLTPIPEEDFKRQVRPETVERVEAEIARRLEFRKQNLTLCQSPEYSIHPWTVASQILRTEAEVREYVQDRIRVVREIGGDEIVLDLDDKSISPNAWVAKEISQFLPGLNEKTVKIWASVYTELMTSSPP